MLEIILSEEVFSELLSIGLDISSRCWCQRFLPPILPDIPFPLPIPGLQVEQLTKDWSDSWRDKKELLEEYSVDINRDRAGFLINSLQPHLVALDGDVLSTGVVFYHLRV